MGLFSKTKNETPNERPLRPIEIDRATVDDADRLLGQVEAGIAVGGGSIRVAVRALAERAGAVDLEVILGQGLNPQETKRTWLWLERVAMYAQTAGDDELVARIYLFTSWFASLHGKFMMADYMDMLTDPVPPKTYRSITVTGRDSLRRLPAEAPVTAKVFDSPTVGALLAQAEHDVATEAAGGRG